jgi:uncharacterized protein (DUF697 family)
VDEIVAFLTAGEGGVGLPANLAFAVLSVCAEVFFLTRLQVQLVTQIGALAGASPAGEMEDALAALAIAFNGADPEMLVNMPAASMQARAQLQEQLNGKWKAIARKIGMKVFRRSLVKAAVPIGAIAMSAGASYRSTMAVSRAARQYFGARRGVLQAS